MITITNIRNAKASDFDEIWAIVRSLKNKSGALTQVSELSPSWDLFKTYLSLKEQGAWNADTFAQIYRPRFLDQMARDPRAQARLDKLISKHQEGKHIALVCFCTDVSLCHRSIISEMLTARGIAHTLS